MLSKDQFDQMLAALDQRLDSKLSGLAGVNPADFDQILGKHLSTPKRDTELGINFARLVTMEAMRKHGKDQRALAKAFWGEEFLKYADAVETRQLAVGSDTIGGGGAAVPTATANEIIEPLRAASVVLAAGPRRIGLSGRLSMPGLNTGASGSWVGENENITVGTLDWRSLIMSTKRYGTLVAIGNDWIRRAIPGGDVFVRDDTVNSLAEGMDLAFLQGAGTEHTPKGLKNWAGSATTTTANVTVNPANVAADLGSVVGKVKRALKRNPRKGTWFMDPRSEEYLLTAVANSGNGNYVFKDEMMNRGKLHGYPYFVTSQIPITLGSGNESYILFVDMDAVVVGDELGLTVETSNEATVYDSSGNPISAFQKDLTLVRVIAETDIVVRHAAAVGLLDAVSWGA